MPVYGNKYRQIYIGGYNVKSQALSIGGDYAKEVKPEWGGMPTVPRLEVQFENSNNTISALSQQGILRGAVLQNTQFVVTNEQGTSIQTEWDGYIETLTEDYASRTATISSMTPLARKMNAPAQITLGADTPANLSKSLFELYNIPVNEANFAYADSLQSGLVSVQMDPNLFEGNITLMEAQKQLAMAGYGRIYNTEGKMNYQVFESSPAAPITIDLDDRDIYSHPIIDTEERNESSYQVKYLDGTVESTGFISGGENQSLDFGPSSVIKIQDLTSATQVADQWELISKIRSLRVAFAVSNAIGSILNLNSYITLTWDRAGFAGDILEIVEIDRTDPRFTKIAGRLTL